MLERAALMAFIPTLNKTGARRFYGETLGLTFVADAGFALVFDANGTRVRVTPVQEFVPQPFTVLGWEVDDLPGTAEELMRRGVTFEIFPGTGVEQDGHGIWHAPNGDQVAWFKDPDGNLLSISSFGGAN